MNILLVYTPAPDKSVVLEKNTFSQPLGLAYLAGILQENKINVSILDANAENLSTAQVILRIKKDTPDLVGLSSVTPNFPSALSIAKALKKIRKPPIIVLGGPHITAAPQSMLKFPFFDYGVLGEGEHTLLELINALQTKRKNIKNVKGLAFVKNNKLKLTFPRPFIKKLDSLPLPARNLLPPLSAYHTTINYKKLPIATMVTSRGCPFKCLFCDRSVFGNAYRARSPKNVVDEMEILIKDYGAKEIQLLDDTFNLEPQRVEQICSQIIKRKLKFFWSCLGRVNFVNKKTLLAMKKAGCWRIAYGIESGNQKVLETISKSLTLEMVKKAVDLTTSVGIGVHGFFMLGLPGDTKESMQQTIDFAKSLKLSLANFYITTPYPGTELSKRAKEFGSIKKIPMQYYLNQTATIPPFVPHGLKSKTITKYVNKAYREFYIRPSYILQNLLQIRSLSQAKNYIEAFFILYKTSK